MKGRTTTMVVEEEVKKRLDKIKLHPREPYNDVIKRIIDEIEKRKE